MIKLKSVVIFWK